MSAWGPHSDPIFFGSNKLILYSNVQLNLNSKQALQLCKCPHCHFGQLSNAHLVTIPFRLVDSSEVKHAKDQSWPFPVLVVAIQEIIKIVLKEFNW